MGEIIFLSVLLVLCVTSILLINKKMECNDLYFKYDELEKIKKCINSCITVKQVQDTYAWINYLVMNKKAKVWERCGFFTDKDKPIDDDWDHLRYACFYKKKELEKDN